MKKHLIAAAVAAAVAAPAMAQNVTLFGTLDGGVANLSKVDANGNGMIAFTDGAVSSSVWGIRGSEDLGGGLRAQFELQGDALLNNGSQNQVGIFRRQANVGVAGAFGEIAVGVKTNPIIATNAALMPVSGNTVSTNTASTLGYADFFTKNAVTWTSPNLNGLVAQVQYGFANTAQPDTNAGRMYAGSAAYTMGGLTLRYAMQDRQAAALAGGAPANASLSGKTSSVLGASYKFGDWTLAAATHSNQVDSANFAANTTLTAGRTYKLTQFGAGYQLNPATTLGMSYTSGEGSTMINMQARYMLSKRTTAYVQYNTADNGGNIAFGTIGTNTGTNNNTHYSSNTTTVVTGFAPANQQTNSLGFGIIHTF